MSESEQQNISQQVQSEATNLSEKVEAVEQKQPDVKAESESKGLFDKITGQVDNVVESVKQTLHLGGDKDEANVGKTENEPTALAELKKGTELEVEPKEASAEATEPSGESDQTGESKSGVMGWMKKNLNIRSPKQKKPEQKLEQAEQTVTDTVAANEPTQTTATENEPATE